jgi:hypothetical protein
LTPEAAIHVALITRAETLSFDLVYPAITDDRPDGEYVEIRHLPNSSRRLEIGPERLHRMGILQATLCGVPGQHEAVYIEKAGQIAATFGRSRLPTVDSVTITIERADIAQGFADGKHWRVPVSVYYKQI